MLTLQASSVRFRREIIDAETGIVVKSTPFVRNLLLDWGLEAMAGTTVHELWKVCVLGTGSKLTKRDSGTITAALSGTTVTASAAFFEAADVGRVLRFDGDTTEWRIASFGSSTQVEVSTSGTVTAQEFTVWYANETTHETEYIRTGTFATDSGFNSSTYSAGVWTHRRTFITASAFTETKLITEIGWSSTTTAGAPLFGRALIPGGGDLVTSGQKYRVQVELSTAYGPTTPQALGNVCADSGFDTTGQWALEGAVAPIVGTDGATSRGGASYYGYASCFEPLGTMYMKPTTSTLALRNMSDWVQSGIPNALAPQSDGGPIGYAQSYVAGSRQRFWKVDISDAYANSTAIMGFGMSAATHSEGLIMRTLFNSAQTKDSLHTLSFTFGLAWSRVLVN